MADSDITTADSSEQVRTLPLEDSTADASFNIWPPNQDTRDEVIYGLVKTLATPSFLSKRYGIIPIDEAHAAVRKFEDEAFIAAGGSVASDGDGMENLKVYSKEISKRILETVKSRTTTANSAAVESVSDQAPPPRGL